MGFWNFVGELLVDAGKRANQKRKETFAEAERYAERYAYLSREELINKFRNSNSFAERMGISKVMKDNGWSVNDED